MKISLIAAIGKNRELGKGNDLVFKIRQDMKYFKEKTMGHAIIMGRKTYESLGRPLPNRTNIVVTRDKNYMVPEGVVLTNSIEEAINEARKVEKEEAFVIGGAQIYELALPLADKLYLTIVNAEDLDADAYFPDYSGFGEIVKETKGEEGDYTYSFIEIAHKS